MSNNQVTITKFQNMSKLATRMRDDLNNQNFVLLYAYNGTGKTRLSMEVKAQNQRKNNNVSNTLYFNAYTEDLFYWNNDFINDGLEPKLFINSESQFFNGLKDLSLEDKIRFYLNRYAEFDFKIDYDSWFISFSYPDEPDKLIKISRGEEVIFIWCLFLALCQLVYEKHESYQWVKYIYIDDPVSSLDDNNTIAIACDLAKLLKDNKDNFKAIISSHHGLFFNVMCNELKKQNHKKYFLYKNKTTSQFYLQATDEVPFFHHVANLSELQKAINNNQIYTYHFNMMRSILEKTSSFLGYNDFSDCLSGIEDEVLYARALNLLSHGNHSIYEPREMNEDNKELFKQIFEKFLAKYPFNLPNLTETQP
ncbi:AAA family ATPase [Glaesserella parasuis]|uniref:AAA family ATPase n=1 Tax=Glaesserella parasuis TaxID=738 RepID=UPI00094F8700|nr:AAA family ATPase [Glaesserella parasuis]MCT8745897.1 AAA family ATPase [Glaesserella parasuis]MCT8791291.1 AAA family ATPase [Glaesserella parasuis]MDG6254767.1 AAA family ATPase [Glaesserella parasuis]MDG6303385.1 AAA family ATPase [Glaesserella parasuis]MDG6352824.1 AAA family ATPase [Glaesserella parasuis]